MQASEACDPGSNPGGAIQREMKMRVAYLECEYDGKGMFSNESILRFVNSKGNTIDGFFQDIHILGLKDAGKKLLRVSLSREYPNGTALIHLPMRAPVYGNPMSENQIVGMEKIIYLEGMKNPN